MSEQAVEDAVVEEAPSKSIEDVEAELAAFAGEPVEEFAGDKDAMWDYWSGLANPSDGPSDDLVWARLRQRRDTTLRDCDYRVAIPDATWDKTPWLAYRQALRDLPESTKDPRKADWPTPPE